MGISASYRRITPEKFLEIQKNPEIAESFFYPDYDEDYDHFFPPDDDRYFDLDKDWHALHFLLTGESSLDETKASAPYCYVVMGGTPTQFEASYGFVRYLTPEEVKAVAELLNTISVDELRQRFDPAAFNALEIYPNPSPGGWDEEELEGLFEKYPELVKFFQNAAQDGDIVLLSSD